VDGLLIAKRNATDVDARERAVVFVLSLSIQNSFESESANSVEEEGEASTFYTPNNSIYS
jgi:hypothetical protein